MQPSKAQLETAVLLQGFLGKPNESTAKTIWNTLAQINHESAYELKGGYYQDQTPIILEKGRAKSPTFWINHVAHISLLIIVSPIMLLILLWQLVQAETKNIQIELKGSKRKATQAWEMHYVEQHAPNPDYQI